MPKIKDLFGNEIDVFVEAKERYGVFPTTVWPLNMQDKSTKYLKGAVGDDGSAREGVLHAGATKGGMYDVGASIFNPALAAYILNMYAPRNGVCFDPFSGGGTRAIMAAKHGMRYNGIELRQVEIDAVMRRCEANEVDNMVEIVCGDSTVIAAQFADESCDFLITCPPYYDLEQYKGGAADLSMCPHYTDFLAGIYKVMQHSFRILKKNTTAVWVVGLTRGEEGELLALNHDIAGLGRLAGFKLKEEIILNVINNGSTQRVGNFDKGKRFLVRQHEYAVVLRKGTIASDLPPLTLEEEL